MITKLSIAGVRNITEARLDGLSRCNVFHGENGSGKTSILETIHLLSTTRSFRSRKVATVISEGQDRLLAYAELGAGNDSESVRRLGVERSLDGARQVRLDGETLRSFGDLAQVLPVQLINSDSFLLLEGSPAVRRQMLDWGLFHVKHQGFFSVWRRYARALKQRNALLKQRKPDGELAPWTAELAAAGEQLHEIRSAFAEVFIAQFDRVYAELLSSLGKGRSADLTIDYSAGWDQSMSLAERLQQGLATDRSLSYTRAGPHRADLRLRLSGRPAAETLSRGQIKTAVCALKISLGGLLSERTSSRCVYLIDDLPSELDAAHREVLWDMFSGLGSQLWLTGVESSDFSSLGVRDSSMFHVKHGVISPV